MNVRTLHRDTGCVGREGACRFAISSDVPLADPGPFDDPFVRRFQA
jgi:hypothetical protein